MNHLFHTDEEDEERQWLEGMENQDEPEIKEAVRIQDSISKMMMSKPLTVCLLYTSPSPRDLSTSRMPSSA